MFRCEQVPAKRRDLTHTARACGIPDAIAQSLDRQPGASIGFNKAGSTCIKRIPQEVCDSPEPSTRPWPPLPCRGTRVFRRYSPKQRLPSLAQVIQMSPVTARSCSFAVQIIGQSLVDESLVKRRGSERRALRRNSWILHPGNPERCWRPKSRRLAPRPTDSFGLRHRLGLSAHGCSETFQHRHRHLRPQSQSLPTALLHPGPLSHKNLCFRPHPRSSWYSTRNRAARPTEAFPTCSPRSHALVPRRSPLPLRPVPAPFVPAETSTLHSTSNLSSKMRHSLPSSTWGLCPCFAHCSGMGV